MAEPEVTYRLAGEEDRQRLEKLIAASARGLSRGFYSAEQVESALVHVFGVDTQLLLDGTYYAAEIGRELVACGGWSKRKTLYGGDNFKREAPDPLLDPKQEAARIRAFFVHPEWGRRGLGKGLLSVCETAARAEGFTALELGSTLPGVPFYGALGFVPYDEVELKFPDGVVLPIVCMRRAI
jgi:GNAT superfamily N-acetyltransferase